MISCCYELRCIAARCVAANRRIPKFCKLCRAAASKLRCVDNNCGMAFQAASPCCELCFLPSCVALLPIILLQVESLCLNVLCIRQSRRVTTNHVVLRRCCGILATTVNRRVTTNCKLCRAVTSKLRCRCPAFRQAVSRRCYYLR